jgi:dipeptidyl aminopeptidase/acylaminoacyl peptidase
VCHSKSTRNLLAGVLRKRGATFKTRFFPEEGHVFTSSAMSKVREAAVEFFHRHFGQK